jgi:hypothetical protein
MVAPAVGIVGLRALSRDVHRLTDDRSSALYAGMKAAGKAAAEPVAAAARATVPRDGDVLAETIRTSATRTGATVRMGSAAAPYAGWVEFGGTIHGRNASREYIAAGRYLFPAARMLGDLALENYDRELSAVFASDRVWTNTTNDGGQVHD